MKCTYPDCYCPFDAPADPNWCARGLPKPKPGCLNCATAVCDECDPARTDTGQPRRQGGQLIEN